MELGGLGSALVFLFEEILAPEQRATELDAKVVLGGARGGGLSVCGP